MSKEADQTPGGGDADSSGKGKEQKTDIETDENKFVSRDAYSKSVTAEKNAKARAKAAEAELEKLKADKEAEANEKLKEEKRWQEIAEANEKKAADAIKERDELYGDIETATKREAVLNKLGGKLKNPNYSSFLDLSKVNYDAETGECDASSVEEVANLFMAEHSGLVETKSDGKLPGGTPRKGQGKSLTHAEWLKLPTAEKRLRMNDVKD